MGYILRCLPAHAFCQPGVAQEGFNRCGKRSRLWVDKGRFLPLQVEQLGVDGNPTKRILFADFENKEKSWIPSSVRMLDLARGSSTELKLTKLELNSGVKDNFFTEANIKKGA